MATGRIERLMMRRGATRALYRLVESLDHSNAPLVASAMAFDAFLSLVPLVALAGYLIQRLHQSGEAVLGPLERAAPGPVGDFVRNDLNRLSEGGGFVIAPVGLGAFVWVSSGGISTAMAVIEEMVHSPPRPWWLRRIIAIGCVLVGFVLSVAGALVALGISLLPSTLVVSTLELVVPPVAVTALLVTFFRVAVRGPRPRRSLLPGAVTTTALWSIVSGLFSLYVARFSRYATLYGSLATAAIFLFWLWLLALGILVGAEVNAMLEGLRDHHPRPKR